MRVRRIKWVKGEPSGIDQPSAPPKEADALDTVHHYIVHFSDQFAKARRVVKHRASNALIVAGLGNTAVVVVGGVITTWSNLSWLGIVSSGLAATVAIVVSWDRHFQHADLWIQRSIILQRLQELRRNSVLAAKFADSLEGQLRQQGRDDYAKQALKELNEILRVDIESWTSIRGNGASQAANQTESPRSSSR